MVYAHQIRAVVSAFVESGDDKRFVLDFGSLTFDIEHRGNAAAVELARAVKNELTLAHASHLSKVALIRSLRDVVDTKAAYNYSAGQAAWAPSLPVNRLMVPEKGAAAWAAASGRAPAVVFGSGAGLQP